MFSCVACGGVRVVVATPIYNDACLAVYWVGLLGFLLVSVAMVVPCELNLHVNTCF